MFNRAGLGLGGVLTKIGETFHKILGRIGQFIQDRLNKFAQNFQIPNVKTDVDTSLYKELVGFIANVTIVFIFIFLLLFSKRKSNRNLIRKVSLRIYLKYKRRRRKNREILDMHYKKFHLA